MSHYELEAHLPVRLSWKGFETTVLADSLNVETNTRATTFRVRYPLMVHAEMCRHKVVCRSVNSNRAMSLSQTIDSTLNNPYIPFELGKDGRGMGSKELVKDVDATRLDWQSASDDACMRAKRLVEDGLHKQWTNRIISPFQWMNEVITATEWDNQFALRCHSAAQPEAQAINNLMYWARKKSTPERLSLGSWHAPYILPEEQFGGLAVGGANIWDLLRVSAARCARQSYNTTRLRDYSEEIDLYCKLMNGNPKHVSPTEHQLRAEPSRIEQYWIPSEEPAITQQIGAFKDREKFYGPFQGFIPFRMLHAGDNILDCEKFWKEIRPADFIVPFEEVENL